MSFAARSVFMLDPIDVVTEATKWATVRDGRRNFVRVGANGWDLHNLDHESSHFERGELKIYIISPFPDAIYHKWDCRRVGSSTYLYLRFRRRALISVKSSCTLAVGSWEFE